MSGEAAYAAAAALLFGKQRNDLNKGQEEMGILGRWQMAGATCWVRSL
jgi:hypothetical protein